MMRGGSICAKYCRKSGSRQFSGGPWLNGPWISIARHVKTKEEARELAPAIILYGCQTLAFKALFVYIGYKAATVRSPYDPEKFASEVEDLREKNQLLEKLQRDQRMKSSN